MIRGIKSLVGGRKGSLISVEILKVVDNNIKWGGATQNEVHIAGFWDVTIK